MKFLALILTLRVLLPVNNQQEFDRLESDLETVLASGDTLADVRLAPGVYYFRENHLLLDGIDRPDFHLRISGNGAVLVAVSTGREYHLDKGYVDLSALEPVDIREPVRKAGCWPVPVPFRRGLYMIRCDESDRSEDEVAGWHIILSQWFKGAVYPVVKIRRGWLFFRKERTVALLAFLNNKKKCKKRAACPLQNH